MLDFLKKIIEVLNDNNISYMLSGSVAMSVYILPRATRDFDFIISLPEEEIDAFVEKFREGYDCDVDAVRDAVKRKSMFNIIDHASGFKANFLVLKNSRFRQTEFQRRVKADFLGLPIYIVAAEDLLLSKLIWIQDVQSHIQMDDIRNLKEMKQLDWEYINSWITEMDLNTFGLI